MDCGWGKAGSGKSSFRYLPLCRQGQRVSAINSLILGLPGDKLTPGAASEAAFVCCWQEALWAVMGARSCRSAGMSQRAPTLVVHLASRRESPVELAKRRPCSPSACWGGLLRQGCVLRGNTGDLQPSLGIRQEWIFIFFFPKYI